MKAFVAALTAVRNPLRARSRIQRWPLLLGHSAGYRGHDPSLGTVASLEADSRVREEKAAQVGTSPREETNKAGDRSKPRALAHAAGHEAPNFSTRRIGPAKCRVGPNHSSACSVWLGDYGIVGNVDPSALKTDAVMAILRLPINVADNKAVRERTT